MKSPCWYTLACLLAMHASPLAAQDKAPPKRPPLVRPAPSAVEPMERTAGTASAVALSMLGVAFVTKFFRLKRRAAVRQPTREEIPVVIPVIPVVTLVPKRRYAIPDQWSPPRDAGDELPPASPPPIAERATVALGVIEALARVLQTARLASVAGNRLFRKLQPAFVGVDDDGALWTVGVGTGTWYCSQRGQWVARMPPERVFLDAALFQKLLELQSAYPSAR